MEFEQIQQVVVDVLHVDEDEVKIESRFVDDLGADSLDIYRIIMGLEETFDIEIDHDVAYGVETVSDVVERIKSARQE